MQHQDSSAQIVPPTATPKSFADHIKAHDLLSVQEDFDRALDNVDADPAAAAGAASSMVESCCKVIIEKEGWPLPPKQTIKPLCETVIQGLGIAGSPDVKALVTALRSTVDAVGTLRSHESAAHGKGMVQSKLEKRHAHLAVNAALAIVTYFVEEWQPKAVNLAGLGRQSLREQREEAKQKKRAALWMKGRQLQLAFEKPFQLKKALDRHLAAGPLPPALAEIQPIIVASFEKTLRLVQDAADEIYEEEPLDVETMKARCKSRGIGGALGDRLLERARHGSSN